MGETDKKDARPSPLEIGRTRWRAQRKYALSVAALYNALQGVYGDTDGYRYRRSSTQRLEVCCKKKDF